VEMSPCGREGSVPNVPKENAASTDLILNPVTSTLRTEATCTSETFGTAQFYTGISHQKRNDIYMKTVGHASKFVLKRNADTKTYLQSERCLRENL
jgi:hypothetical protein